MSTQVHRHTDSRICGATTIVSGQSNVYVNNLLASVQGDANSHGAGQLSASINDGTVYINGKKVVLKGSSASPDTACAPAGPPHCNPKAVGASANVFACGGSGGGGPDEAGPDPSRSDLYGPDGGGGGVPDPNVQRNADGSPMDGDVNEDGQVDNADQNVDISGVSPGYPDDLTQAEIESVIREEAVLRGIDPDTAVGVFRSEGAVAYQSQIPANNNRAHNGKEASFGPYQLYTGVGLGREYENQTGRNLITDNTREGVTNQVRFALDEAAGGGTWKPWHGADRVGIDRQQGLGGARRVDNWN